MLGCIHLGHSPPSESVCWQTQGYISDIGTSQIIPGWMASPALPPEPLVWVRSVYMNRYFQMKHREVVFVWWLPPLVCKIKPCKINLKLLDSSLCIAVPNKASVVGLQFFWHPTRKSNSTFKKLIVRLFHENRANLKCRWQVLFNQQFLEAKINTSYLWWKYK